MKDQNQDALALLADMREEVAALKLRVNALDAVREELNALKLHVSALEQSAAKAAAAPAPAAAEAAPPPAGIAIIALTPNFSSSALVKSASSSTERPAIAGTN